MAGIAECLGGFLFAEAIDEQPLFSKPHGQAGEVAVAGDQTVAIEAAGVEQIHGVDDHGAVGRILTRGVGELLDRFDRVPVQDLVPRCAVGRGEIAIDSPDRRFTETGDFLEQTLDNPGLGVVRVDEDGEAPGWLFGFYPEDCFWLHERPIELDYPQSMAGEIRYKLRLIPKT